MTMNILRFFTIILMTIFLASCADDFEMEDLATTEMTEEISLERKKGHVIEFSCPQNCSVPYWEVANQLNCTPLSGVTCPTVVSELIIGYDNGWLWEGSDSEIFSCEEQSSIKDLAENIALSQAPTCSFGSLEIQYEYFLDFCSCGVFGSSLYTIGVKITYKCCLTGGIVPN